MSIDYTKGLNPMQQTAVKHTDGPLLLIAGAGSGKTRVLTHRMAYIASELARPYELLAITFTNRAAKEMKERILSLAGDAAHDMWVSTFHACCVRILRRDIHHIGFDNSFTIYDMDDSAKLIKFVLKQMNLNEKQWPPKSMQAHIGRQKDELVSPKDFAAGVNDYRGQILAEIYKNYQSQLQSNNALDFDDIILKTLELFMYNPAVLEKYANRFKYIMVDEYQDTNTAQYQLVRMLASAHGNICVVGDDDQSIYGWRGANIRNILDFEKDFYGAVTIKLEQNYRSTGKILQAANGVISNNDGRKGKNLWTDSLDGENLTYFSAQSDYAEADFIVEKVREGLAKGAKHKDFAVLYRMNSQSRVIEEKLAKSGIRYRVFGGQRFYERREIKDVLAYLRAIHNPHDDISVKRVINVPKRGIGNVAVEAFEGIAAEHGIKFFDALANPTAHSQNNARNKKMLEFAQMIQAFHAAATELSLSELVKLVLTKTGYHNSILEEDAAEGTDRAGNISELINNAAVFESESENPTLAGFLEEVALVADIDSHDDSDDAIALMTLHSSKGLEFPIVFLPGLEEGIFPAYRAITSGNPNDVEEERRLCYVGITRAKRQVHLSSATQRMHNGQTTYNSPSRFIGEVPPDLLDTHNDKSVPPRQSFLPKGESGKSTRPAIAPDASSQSNFGKKWDLSKIMKK